jgi:hypothetical protein
MKTYWWSWGVTAPFLTLSFAVSGQLHPRYPFDRSLGGPQSRYGRYGKDEDLTPAGNRTPAVQAVARRYTDFLLSNFATTYFV